MQLPIDPAQQAVKKQNAEDASYQRQHSLPGFPPVERPALVMAKSPIKTKGEQVHHNHLSDRYDEEHWPADWGIREVRAHRSGAVSGHGYGLR
ncbi:hypothetical protein D9M71_619430 [compost metagenome]